MIGKLKIQTAQEIFQEAFSGILNWLTSRNLEVEHLGMLAVIALSTWHVSQHMEKVEGGVMSLVMGMVLGLLNALFSMRFFETKEETRIPAITGVVFFASTSIWMQYAFYNHNQNMINYPVVIFGHTLNFNALVNGSWAPLSEILLGWIYGVRLFTSRKKKLEIDQLCAHYEKTISDLDLKFAAQLRAHQGHLDEFAAHQIEHDKLVNGLRAEIALRGEKITSIQEKMDKLIEDNKQLLVSNSALNATVNVTRSTAQSGAQLRGKLSGPDRQEEVKRLIEKKPSVTIAELARETGASTNTIREDLKRLGIDRSK